MYLDLLSSLNHVLHQHRSGNSADTTGNGGDCLNNGLDLVEDAVAGHAALALGGDLLGVPVHGNVDDDLAFTDEILGQAVQNTGCGDDDVSALADLSGVDSAGVANGNSCVLCHQHHCCGLADNQGAADDNSVLTLAVDAVVVQNFHASCGSAGSIAQILTLEDTCVGHMGHGVNVLLGVQAVANLVLICLQVLGQGAEHQAAVNGIVSVDLIDNSQDLFLGGSFGQDEVLDSNADLFSALGSALLVGQVGGVLTQTQDCQGGGRLTV